MMAAGVLCVRSFARPAREMRPCRPCAAAAGEHRREARTYTYIDMHYKVHYLLAKV